MAIARLPICSTGALDGWKKLPELFREMDASKHNKCAYNGCACSKFIVSGVVSIDNN